MSKKLYKTTIKPDHLAWPVKTSLTKLAGQPDQLELNWQARSYHGLTMYKITQQNNPLTHSMQWLGYVNNSIFLGWVKPSMENVGVQVHMRCLELGKGLYMGPKVMDICSLLRLSLLVHLTF